MRLLSLVGEEIIGPDPLLDSDFGVRDDFSLLRGLAELTVIHCHTLTRMPAVVLQGPANTAPETIVGPFVSMTEAEEWATTHPRQGGYSVAMELSAPA
jgi:hypothetical protein